MKMSVTALCLMELAVPTKAIFNNLGNHLPAGIEIHGRTQVDWSDGSTSEGVKHPGCAYLIRTDDRRILVDTGIGHLKQQLVAFRKARGDIFYLRQEPEWALDVQLQRFGLTPDDIDTVIMTHLHYDHLGGMPLFNNARFYVQKDELPFAFMTPRYAPFYFECMRESLIAVSDRLIVVEGDQQVVPGIELWKLGGHSPGSQAVALRTGHGTVVLAADVIPKYENWDHDWPGAAGNIWNMDEQLRAHERLRKEADLLVPGHDWRVWEFHQDGVIL